MPTEVCKAAEQENLYLIKRLIRGGGSPHVTESRAYGYQTLLHWAGSREVAAYLIEQGADVHTRDDFAQTPLHTASSAGVAEVLLAHEADPTDVASVSGANYSNGDKHIPIALTPFQTVRSKECGCGQGLFTLSKLNLIIDVGEGQRHIDRLESYPSVWPLMGAH